jgi:hypothetical protein
VNRFIDVNGFAGVAALVPCLRAAFTLILVTR